VFLVELTLCIVSDENVWMSLYSILVRLLSASKLRGTVRKVVFESDDIMVPLYVLNIGGHIERYCIEPNSVDAIFIFSSNIAREVVESLQTVIKDEGRVFVSDEIFAGDNLEDVKQGSQTIYAIAYFLYILSKYLSLSKRFVVKVLKSISNENVNELIEKYRLVSRNERV